VYLVSLQLLTETTGL